MNEEDMTIGQIADERIKQRDILIRKLVKALQQIVDGESVACSRCEGGGRLWADGKVHYQSGQRETMACGNCGGSGKLQPENAQEIAQAALADARYARDTGIVPVKFDEEV